MSQEMIGVIVWAILMVLAIPYVRHAKHPRSRFLAAYLLFVAIFSLCATVMLYVLLTILGRYAMPRLFDSPVGSIAFLILIFAPAYLVARWQLKKPPRRVEPE